MSHTTAPAPPAPRADGATIVHIAAQLADALGETEPEPRARIAKAVKLLGAERSWTRSAPIDQAEWR